MVRLKTLPPALNLRRQSLRTLPGLKVVTYATADDAYGLLKASIQDNNPVIFMESELTYGHKGEVPDEEYVTPIGKARIRNTGSDITLISWGKQVLTCQDVVAKLEEQGISVDFLDLRSLRPLDETAIYESVAKTGKCVVTHEGHLYAGVGAEIVSQGTTNVLLVPRSPCLACHQP